MLEIQNLSKTYKNGTCALNNVNINIGKGMFGLLGPNGAGKSTLMRIMATLQMPDSGFLNFEGISVLNTPIELQKILGYLPQSFGVYPKISAEKLLDYFGLLKGISSKGERQKIVQHVLELTNLFEVRKKSVSGYSGGMKQRFGIAQLLLNNPKLIIVDEPTAGLDPGERNRFLNVLREVGSENTVIFSTHIVDDVSELCNDMAIINKGEILKHNTPKQLIKKITNKVWTKNIATDAIERYQENYHLLSSGFNADNSMNIRIYANNEPEDGFVHATANLEDVYFLSLNPNKKQ
ncbi:ABC transporter ATP-binding protein [Croceitalea rosinachiae]|uniref:ABC transporter ATP-binding protein n=1 Tax=Croceitalea rosinachiae TaxID=3075596 RepID=A0ABU3AAI7_9FLAO|nr:ABC transporter ATP-binding protein [Croceitalea sp. F388]MDT0605941.1 ABC transporter ATP-binding protein [Croceitalea sp. F388]